MVLVLASGSRPLTAPPHVDPLGPPPRLSEGWFFRPGPITPHLCQVLQCSAVSKVSFEYLSGTPKALRDRALVPRPNLLPQNGLSFFYVFSAVSGPASSVSRTHLSCPSKLRLADHLSQRGCHSVPRAGEVYIPTPPHLFSLQAVLVTPDSVRGSDLKLCQSMTLFCIKPSRGF